MPVHNNYYYMSACIRCLDYELNLGDVDPSAEPVAEACLLLDSYEWESPQSDSCSNVQSEIPQSYPPVQGRLKEHSAFWLNELESSSFVESIVSQGYQLPFIKLPDPVCLMNHRSAYESSAFVSTELIAGRCVIKSKGKQRLVVDLRYINQFLPERKFKYEGLNLIPLLFSSGDFFTTFDLKSGYHHVDIHQDSWPYLGLSWGFGQER